METDSAEANNDNNPYDLATRYCNEGRDEEAKSLFLKLFATRPISEIAQCKEALANLGFIYHKENDAARAYIYYKAASNLGDDAAKDVLEILIENNIKDGQTYQDSEDEIKREVDRLILDKALAGRIERLQQGGNDRDI